MGGQRTRARVFRQRKQIHGFQSRSFVYNLLCTILNGTPCHMHIQQTTSSIAFYVEAIGGDGGLCQHSGIFSFMKHSTVNTVSHLADGIQCWKIKSLCSLDFRFSIFLFGRKKDALYCYILLVSFLWWSSRWNEARKYFILLDEIEILLKNQVHKINALCLDALRNIQNDMHMF